MSGHLSARKITPKTCELVKDGMGNGASKKRIAQVLKLSEASVSNIVNNEYDYDKYREYIVKEYSAAKKRALARQKKETAKVQVDTPEQGCTAMQQPVPVYPPVLANAVKCLSCEEILRSYTVHDFQCCSCANQTFTDGGHEYVRQGGINMMLVKDLSVYSMKAGAWEADIKARSFRDFIKIKFSR